MAEFLWKKKRVIIFTVMLKSPSLSASVSLSVSQRERIMRAAQDDYDKQRKITYGKVIAGDPDRPCVALTFDDGPYGFRSGAVLEVLKRYRVPATFFMVGRQIEKYPDLVIRTVLEGHECANHSFHHYRLPKIPLEEVVEELNATNDALRKILGVRSRLFRPPGGEYNIAIQRVIEKLGYINVLWSADPADYRENCTPRTIVDTILRDLRPGGIILLHDGLERSTLALPELIERVQEKGWSFVTVSELLIQSKRLPEPSELRFSRTAAT
jgi:peptidoglycan-N-acetylglucosamine deacetylase